MRELTLTEKTLLLTIQTQWVSETSLAGMPVKAVAYGFTAGLAHQDARIAELERQLAEAKRPGEPTNNGELAQRLLEVSARFSHNKLGLIKAIRSIDDSLGLKEAKERVEELFYFEGNSVTIKGCWL